jgi:hypothetical protein
MDLYPSSLCAWLGLWAGKSLLNFHFKLLLLHAEMHIVLRHLLLQIFGAIVQKSSLGLISFLCRISLHEWAFIQRFTQRGICKCTSATWKGTEGYRAIFIRHSGCPGTNAGVLTSEMILVKQLVICIDLLSIDSKPFLDEGNPRQDKPFWA